MTAQTPNPVPTEGQRKLVGKAFSQRMQAVIATSTPPSGLARCEGQVYVGIFFDGTGNNMDIDYYGGDGSSTEGNGRAAPLPPDKRQHTNVVKLYPLGTLAVLAKAQDSLLGKKPSSAKQPHWRITA